MEEKYEFSKKRLIAFSTILIIVGSLLGFSVYTLASLSPSYGTTITPTEITAPKIGTIIYADQYSSIQDAIDFGLPSEGGTVFIPAGTYRISKRILLPRSNIMLVGAGKSTIIYVEDYTNATAIFGNSIENVTISNLRIFGNRVHQNFDVRGPHMFDGFGICFYMSKNIHIEDVWVSSTYVSGIVLWLSDMAWIRGCFSEDNGGDGIGLSGANMVTVEDCFCLNNGQRDVGGVGIWMNDCSDIKVIGVTAKGNTQAGLRVHTFNGMAKKVVISSCIVYNNTYQGIWIGRWQEPSFNESEVSREYTCVVQVDNCLVYDNHAQGFFVNNTRYVTISSNQVLNNKIDGIALWNSSDAIIENNIVANNSHYGIQVSQKSHNCILSGNLVKNNGYCKDPPPGQQGLDGICVRESDNTTISNNRCYNNEENEIRIWDSKYTLVHGNNCYGKHPNQETIVKIGTCTGSEFLDNIPYNPTDP